MLESRFEAFNLVIAKLSAILANFNVLRLQYRWVWSSHEGLKCWGQGGSLVEAHVIRPGGAPPTLKGLKCWGHSNFFPAQSEVKCKGKLLSEWQYCWSLHADRILLSGWWPKKYLEDVTCMSTCPGACPHKIWFPCCYCQYTSFTWMKFVPHTASHSSKF